MPCVNDELFSRLRTALRPGISRRGMVAIVVAAVVGSGDALARLATSEADRRQKRRRRKKKNRRPKCQAGETRCGGKLCCAPGQQCLGATFGCVNGTRQPGEECDPAVPLECASGECGSTGAACVCRDDTCAPVGVSCVIDLDCCTGYCLGATACQEGDPVQAVLNRSRIASGE